MSGATGGRIQGRFKARLPRATAPRRARLPAAGQASALTIPRGSAFGYAASFRSHSEAPGIRGNVGPDPGVRASEKPVDDAVGFVQAVRDIPASAEFPERVVAARSTWPLSFGERGAAVAERPPRQSRRLPPQRARLPAGPCRPARMPLRRAAFGSPCPDRDRRGSERLLRTAPSTRILPLRVSALFRATRGCAGDAAIAATEGKS